jgi:type I pantothenate kinase
VGKSTFASAIATSLSGDGLVVEIVSTDGFLFPNATLAARGLVMHKGFPESYDVVALTAALDALRAGAAEVPVPVYSHETYDIVPGASRAVGRSDVVLLEGLNALGAARDRLDVAVYLDADEQDVEDWFVARFVTLVAEAEGDPGSFYASMVDMPPAELDALARSTWRAINLVNLREHIAPTRALADLVVVKGADHQVRDVQVRGP